MGNAVRVRIEGKWRPRNTLGHCTQLYFNSQIPAAIAVPANAPTHNPGYPQRLSYVARSNQNKNMTFKYVTAEVGQIFAVTDANRCVFHGLDQHPQMVVIGPLLCPKTLLSSKTSRARLLAPFLEADEAFSHQTAAWIHLGIGSPFPLCVVTTLRRRRPTQKLVFYRQHWKQDLDETLSIPVVNVTRTRKDFQLP